MKQTIYIDILFGVNLFINYLLLCCVAKFLSLNRNRKRFVFGALLGAFFSLLILLPEVNIAVSLTIKLLMSLSIVVTAFGYRGLREFIREAVAFYLISFAFAGFMLVLWYFFAPQGLMIRNSVVYFNISPLVLIIFTVICYVGITLFHRITGRQMPPDLNCQILIECGGKKCVCSARVDTGNSLKEPFSGDPVAVVYESVLTGIVPPKDGLNFRLIPFDALSGGGLLQAFRPDRMMICCGNKKVETKKVYVAVAKTRFGEFDALLNPDLLQKTSD
ncbi:MAG: Sporulation sigma-E factor-processing peptidase [Oscillospiraceae bacterium]